MSIESGPSPAAEESVWAADLIQRLGMEEHPEGGYFAETDRSHLTVPNVLDAEDKVKDASRPTSTTIYYLLTRQRAYGYFHRNKSRTIHCLHEGEGVYILLYPPGFELASYTAHIEKTTRGYYARTNLESGWTCETFEVGRDAGVYQWLVEGNIYKCSLLRGVDKRSGSGNGIKSHGLLISEVVSPGFEFIDHNFLGETEYRTIFGNRSADHQTLLNPSGQQE